MSVIQKIQTSGFNEPNFVFYSFLAVFVTDSVINYFYPLPVFVTFGILALPFLWIFTCGIKGFRPFAVISAIFILNSVIHNIQYGFHKRNLSDLLFILLFIASYFYYYVRINELKKRTVILFLLTTILMFSFSLPGFNSSNWRQNTPLYERSGQNKIQSSTELIKDGKLTTRADTKQDSIPSFNEESLEQRSNRENRSIKIPDPIVDKSAPPSPAPDLYAKKTDVDFLETFRQYRNGLFRLPHIASYFFGFLMLFIGWQYQLSRDRRFKLLIAILLLLLLLTGARSVIVAISAGFVLYFFRKKNLIFLLLFTLCLSLLLIFRNQLYFVFKETFLGQYFGMLITFVENFEGFSRILFWKSWYHEISHFSLADYLTGKGFYSSIKANVRNLYFKEWFHSDPLSIVYSYGISGLIAYFYLIYRIFRDNSLPIRKNLFAFIFFTGMIITAVLNGYYYFFPVFLTFIFLKMNHEILNQATRSSENEMEMMHTTNNAHPIEYGK